ncbi:nucleoside-diphosphate-sugar epimerase [Chryseobacterium contaminans]|uniref:Nucleoside-diphosphate-sugar epimerase n=1 Tax=Chryseobacterium contaminans TaxID=1423959 RepID=A0A1M7EDM4_9FLAO|nr:NAD-dependent epimerase/dehydratase family protein [Chryseobacterium contaminans]OCA69871.1 nucleoside-diphosphate-sugar epimerase [Chryseobacterium contaminans]SHL89885.1 Nucleoside-diphosphate-sugar epimerase [Chryseobacterium contaminans]
MNVVITGVSGFVGQNLFKYLEENQCNPVGLSLRNDWRLSGNYDALIHLAGKAHDTANTAADEEYFKINTELTKELFDEFINSDIKDFLYFSSVKATADTVDDILNEDHHSDPKTPYGKSKLLAEEYLLSKVLPAGKRLFIIRPCMIHGPGNKGNLNLLYKVVEKGIPWPLAAFENQRSFLSIDNLNFLILQILKNKNINSGIYNFADDDFISTNKLIQIISKTSGKKLKLLKISKKLIISIAKLGDKIKLPLNSERLKKLTESYAVSNIKIKKALQLSKLPVSAEEGLTKTIKSFQTK